MAHPGRMRRNRIRGNNLRFDCSTVYTGKQRIGEREGCLMSEAAGQAATTTATATVGDKWGDPISEERQRSCRATSTVGRAETHHGERKGPFEGVRLTVPMSSGWQGLDATTDGRHRSPLGGASTSRAQTSRGLKLGFAHLEGCDFFEAHLEGADFHDAYLEKRICRRVCEGRRHSAQHTCERRPRLCSYGRRRPGCCRPAEAVLSRAHLEGADLGDAQLG